MSLLQKTGVAAGIVQDAVDLYERDPQLKHRGFYQILNQLDYERSGLERLMGNYPLFDAIIQFAKETKRNGKPISQETLIRHKLAQLQIEFDDHSAISVSIQMYGGIGSFLDGELDNIYYRVAKEKPSPFSLAFDEVYFDSIISTPEVQKLSLKALLAT
jgi:hypothetical protein